MSRLASDVPWLFRPHTAALSGGEIAEDSLPRLGGCLGWLEETLGAGLRSDGIPFAGAGPEWLGAFARELLLCAMCLGPEARECIAQFCREPAVSRAAPFPDAPLLDTFLNGRAAAAVLPLETPGASAAAFAQLWVFDARCWPEWESFWHTQVTDGGGVARIAGPGSGALLLAPGAGRRRIEGRSWELGAALAAAAMDDPALARKLARDWVVTGAIGDEGAIRQVTFQAKASLARVDLRRDWLLPAANYTSLPPGWEAELGGRLHFARDIPSAVAQIKGEGFASGEDFDWSRSPLHGPDEWHGFASKALGPMLASALWCAPRRAVIWSSERMRPWAEALAAALRELLPATTPAADGVDIKAIADEDLAAIRRTLLAHPLLGRGGGRVVFSLTGGNLIMRLALQDLARLRPNVVMVYRPEERTDLLFRALSYPGLMPVQRAVRHEALERGPARHAWIGQILNSRPAREETPQDFSASLVAAVRGAAV